MQKIKCAIRLEDGLLGPRNYFSRRSRYFLTNASRAIKCIGSKGNPNKILYPPLYHLNAVTATKRTHRCSLFSLVLTKQPIMPKAKSTWPRWTLTLLGEKAMQEILNEPLRSLSVGDFFKLKKRFSSKIPIK